MDYKYDELLTKDKGKKKAIYADVMKKATNQGHIYTVYRDENGRPYIGKERSNASFGTRYLGWNKWSDSEQQYIGKTTQRVENYMCNVTKDNSSEFPDPFFLNRLTATLCCIEICSDHRFYNELKFWCKVYENIFDFLANGCIINHNEDKLKQLKYWSYIEKGTLENIYGKRKKENE